MIYVHIYLRWTGGAAAVFAVGALPFQSAATIQTLSVITNIDTAALTWTGTPVAILEGATYTIGIYDERPGFALAGIQNVNAGTKSICISGTYRV